MHQTAATTPYLVILLSLAFAAAPAHAQGPGPMQVAVSPVIERDVPPAIRLVGTIRADKTAVVAAEVSGLIAAFDAEEGQFLEAGQVICRLDSTVARLRLEEARAALAGLRAQLEELENGERPEEIRRLEALVAQAEAVLAKQEFERKRVTGLFERGQSSDKEKHDVEMDYLAAAASLAQARAQLDRARNGERPEVIARARQAVAAQEATVARLQHDLDKTQIRAPFAGALVAKRTEAGEWIGEGGPVGDLLAMDTVRVRVDVPERAIVFATVGAPATIEVEAIRATRSAAITRRIPQASPAARTFPVEIDVPNVDHALLPGMFVWAYVPAGPAGRRLMASKDAVVARGTNKQVFVVRPGPTGGAMAMPLSVETGLEIAGEIELVAPELRAGDQLVTRGNERIFGPTPVTPMSAAASQPAAGPRAAGPAPTTP